MCTRTFKAYRRASNRFLGCGSMEKEEMVTKEETRMYIRSIEPTPSPNTMKINLSEAAAGTSTTYQEKTKQRRRLLFNSFLT